MDQALMKYGSRIAVVGDWFRAHPTAGAGPGTVHGNVRWLAGLLSAGLGIPVQRQQVVLPNTTTEGFHVELHNQSLAALYDRDPLAAWLSKYDDDGEDDTFPSLFDQLAGADLVIGFELPPVMRRRFALRGLRYISIHIHPLRFLPDLLLGAYSNCATLREVLQAISMAEPDVYPHVARLTAKLSRLDPCQARLPEHCPVLFGQTPIDASLMLDGKINTWPDHKDKLISLLDGYSHLAFAKHPNAGWPVATLEWLRRDLDKTVIAMSGNAYPVIMAGRQLGPVISLSSSIGVEAAAFGHDNHFLLADPRSAFSVKGLDNDQQFMLGHQFLMPDFWRAVADRATPSDQLRCEPFHLGENFVRGTLEAWSYSAISGSSPLPSCTKIVMPSRQSSDHDIDRVVAEVAGFSPECPQSRRLTISEAASHGTEIRCLPPVLDNGASWHWDRSTECLNFPGSDALGPIEGDGAWLEGSRCELRLALRPTKALGHRLKGEVGFSFFRGVSGEYPAMLLRANERPVAAWIQRGTNDIYHSLPFDFCISANDHCILSFEVSHAASPAQLGLGEDPRQLGIILHDVALSVNDTDGAGEGDILSLWGFGDAPIQIPTSTDRWKHAQV
jgi:hypothetical protein